mgnify:CR=1 FL=1
MKSSKLIEIFKDGQLVVPMYLLKHYKEMKLELNEFVFLMYLYNKGDHFLFDPNKFAEEMSMDLTGITNQNEVRSVAWVRIFQCMKNDAMRNNFERKLSEQYKMKSKTGNRNR